MDEYYYLRPREKLLAIGPSALSRSELIQLIIGSGTQKMRGAALAKQLNQKLETCNWSVDELLAMPGIGKAKATQLIAALELGRRITL